MKHFPLGRAHLSNGCHFWPKMFQLKNGLGKGHFEGEIGHYDKLSALDYYVYDRFFSSFKLCCLDDGLLVSVAQYMPSKP